MNIGKYLVKTGNKGVDDLVMQCLKSNPNDRIKKISSHKYFKNVSLEPSFKPGLAGLLAYDGEEDKPKEFYRIEKVHELSLYENTIRIPTDEYLSNLE